MSWSQEYDCILANHAPQFVRAQKGDGNMKTSHSLAIALSVVSLATLASCEQKAPEPKKADAPEAKKAAEAPAAQVAVAPAADLQPNPERNAYFGEEHIHTSWSVDAWVMGNRITGPDDASSTRRAQTIKHPMGFDIKIDTPMDFMGVTDHSEYVGVTKEANTPGSYVSKLPEAKPLILKDPEQPGRAEDGLLVPAQADRKRAGEGVHGPEDHRPPCGRKTSRSPTRTTIPASSPRSARTSGPRCRTTATCTATSSSGTAPRYRTIRSARSTPPIPTDLWNWMDGQRKAGNELLAISHNANVSDGWMYPIDVDNTTGRPIDAAWAASRDRNERLVEIKQSKGQSETHPLLSPNDEFASYEMYEALLGLPADRGRIDRITGSYARQALKDGIAMQDVARLQPVQVRHGRRLRLAQHRQPLPPGQLLRPPRRCGRLGRAAVGRRPASAAPWTCVWKTPAG